VREFAAVHESAAAPSGAVVRRANCVAIRGRADIRSCLTAIESGAFDPNRSLAGPKSRDAAGVCYGVI